MHFSERQVQSLQSKHGLNHRCPVSGMSLLHTEQYIEAAIPVWSSIASEEDAFLWRIGSPSGVKNSSFN